MRVLTKGLVEIADGIHAYIQPDGSWGSRNAGLAIGDGASTLIDTLFDLALTRQMLDKMASLTRSSPITVAPRSCGRVGSLTGSARAI